ncbi:MAG: glycosyltransferase family 9 protein [Cyanobacteria bacterium P01_H01_bin.74]
MQEKKQPPKNILMIRFGALGDIIHAMATAQFLKSEMPNVTLHWLCHPTYAEFIRLGFSHCIDHVWSWPKNAPFQQTVKLVNTLRELKFDGILNLHPSVKTRVFILFLRKQTVCTYRKEKIRGKGFQQRKIKRAHAIDNFFQPASHLIQALNSQQIIAQKIIKPASLNRNQLKQQALPAALLSQLEDLKGKSSQIIGIIPGVGSKRANRAWMPSNYARLIEKLLASPNKSTSNKPVSNMPIGPTGIVLFGGPDEIALSQAIIDTLDNRCRSFLVNTTGQLTLLQTAAAMQYCRLIIGGDTGPAHLASAAGLPVLGLYGPTSVERTGVSKPLEPSLVLPQNAHPDLKEDDSTALERLTEHFTPPEALDCWPCELPHCPYTDIRFMACMKEISVEAVYQKILIVLILFSFSFLFSFA